MSIPITNYVDYVHLDNAEWDIKLREFEQMFLFYANSVGINANNIIINKDNVLEIIDRVEKRRVYFKVFYGKEMSERNEASLYCFWILKLAPFFNMNNPNHKINISFATFLFLRMVTYSCTKNKHSAVINDAYIKHLLYAFSYRDICKESIMALAETFLT